MNKLGIVIGSLGRGGAERVSIYIASYFKSHGWDCDIITLSKQTNEYELPVGIKRYVSYENNVSIPQKIYKIRSKIKESSPDIILIMDTPLCTYTVPALTGLKIPFIVSERNDPTHFSGNRLNIKIARHLMKKASGFVFQTNDAKKFYDKALNSRGVVIPNPLVCENLPEAYTGKREKRIVSVGRLHMQKNHRLLINAFADVHKEHPDYYLDIYGEGGLEAELKNLCHSLNIEDYVDFKGNVTDIPEKIKAASMFVMPSDFEGMPNALIEAMAVGLPCISTNCPIGGPKDLIKNGINGTLINVGNISELSKAINFYIEHSEIASNHGRKAIEVREKLDSNIVGAMWMEYVEKVIK